MVDRRDLGSWLQGPGAASGPDSTYPGDSTSPGDSTYPGERVGRPETGPRSLARPGRRLASLVIDWALCLLIARGFFGPEALQPNGSLSVVGVLVVVNLVLVGAAGATVGQRLVGVQVERVDGGRPGLTKSLIRAVLLGLGIPPLTMLWERDRRGLHDLLSQTVVALR